MIGLSQANTMKYDSDIAAPAKLYNSEDIPLTISASLAKHSSLMRSGGARKNPPHNNHHAVDDYGSNESNDDDDNDPDNDIDGNYTYTTPNQSHSNPHIHYSTMSGDYLRKTNGHFHRNVNNNGAIASTNRYRWHNQSDEISLQSLRNNSMTMAPPSSAKSNAITMHSNHRPHTSSNRKQQQHHLNHINNNCIVTNKKHSAMVQNSHNDHNSIDQNNGNHYLSRLYH